MVWPVDRVSAGAATEKRMERPSFLKHRSWPLLALAFGALLLLILLSEEIVLRNTSQIYGAMDKVQQDYRQSELALNQLRSERYEMALLVRDYLLDPSEPAGDEQRRRFIELQASMTRCLDKVEPFLSPQEADVLRHLREGLKEYWAATEPVFEWAGRHKREEGASFLRRRVVPYRQMVMATASEIEDLIAANLRKQEEASRKAHQELHRTLRLMLGVTMSLGIVIAAVSIARLTALEKRTRTLWRQAEQHRQELQSLSQRLVRAQEEERKSISRELHDQIGQMLTALRMELGNLEILRESAGRDFSEHLRECKTLAEQTLRAVRDMAMGLRPSMLDDLGLAPAVEWQAREFARRTGIPVHVQIDGRLAGLPEGPRICVYRVVQEALTNCARHAQARNIRVTVQGRGAVVSLTVEDDGKGFVVDQAAGQGLGLLGIEERVRELGGKVSIFSQLQKGTVLRAEIPCTSEAPA